MAFADGYKYSAAGLRHTHARSVRIKPTAVRAYAERMAHKSANPLRAKGSECSMAPASCSGPATERDPAAGIGRQPISPALGPRMPAMPQSAAATFVNGLRRQKIWSPAGIKRPPARSSPS